MFTSQGEHERFVGYICRVHCSIFSNYTGEACRVMRFIFTFSRNIFTHIMRLVRPFLMARISALLNDGGVVLIRTRHVAYTKTREAVR